MSLLIQDILQFDLMKEAKVLAGAELVTKKQVEWVSVIEIPVENFVRKNEFVLTTAIGCGQNLEEFEKFVQEIIDSEASALAVATGRHIFDIPREVIDRAEKNDFILIEIPWEVRFSTVIEEVMLKLNDLYHKVSRKSEKVQQELINLILKETELTCIANYLTEKIGYPVIITDQIGTIQAQSIEDPNLLENWKKYVVQGMIPSRKKVPISSHDPMIQKIQTIKMDEYSILQLPVIQVSADTQDYLFVILPSNISTKSFLTPYIVNVLEHAATTIALWFSRKNAVEETREIVHDSFINELINGEFTSWEQANSRAEIVGYDLSLPYICIIGAPENLRELFRKRRLEEKTYKQWHESMIHYIKEEIFYAAQSLNKQIMITSQGDQLLIYLEIMLDSKNESVTNFLDLVDRRLRNLLPKVVISWGIGNYNEDITGFKESYQNAKIALNISRNKKGIGNRVMYENTRIDRVLLSLYQNPEMQDIIKSVIEPLVEYNEQRNLDLINTISTYTRYQGNVSQTARALFLHRQSLLYRLRKIEELTGLSLVDPDDLFLLDLCIKTWKMGN
ncbi:PucR family transcriptional regulator ligand-binding domain-containing protein [Neobacillus thermocopriae]|uniref:PucR family transcriptional regulator n=1 Tax=Neobacillus thermocopriae TaxID=1215031 RepID=UPI002E1D8D1F|nr:PucR family transcriptional regulator ligand-binding domain-containing protein [Neobacillus thermocopriae]MED3713727.1 PucR family transcriptional regulator ligand-binding domain-containing protein [Neobacillus thermocopriae]